ncbi:LysR family transcriptional regulator [Mesorhizobium yinganensis]|uniref:LysR family transcriptional regulator n=1 Tax=Mesorhizobium yinganensis TaxID=3157707 RepID=UPI0032B879D5
MDIDLYKSFLAIYDTGSFTRAAREVGRTQSAISQQIRRLEETLGRPLFTRTAGNVELTEYGKSLLGFARDIVETHAEALAAFSRGSFQGLVVLGIPDGYVKRVMREVLLEFTALYPEATINVVIDDSPGLARRIADGSVDLTFLTEGNWPTRGDIVFKDRLVIAGPATGDLSMADPLPLAVWDERAFDHRLMIEALEGMNRRYRIACICRSVYGKHAAITAGLCASVMVESSLIEGERAYLPEDGFPILADAFVRLERSHLKKSQIVDRLERHLLEHFSRKTLPNEARAA